MPTQTANKSLILIAPASHPYARNLRLLSTSRSHRVVISENRNKNLVFHIVISGLRRALSTAPKTTLLVRPLPTALPPTYVVLPKPPVMLTTVSQLRRPPKAR